MEDKTMDEQAVNMVNELIAKARVAQKQFESFSQEKTDEAVRAIGKVVYDRAEELAKMACEESGMGVYADKVAKCHGKSKCIWNSLKGKKSVGIIGEDKQTVQSASSGSGGRRKRFQRSIAGACGIGFRTSHRVFRGAPELDFRPHRRRKGGFRFRYVANHFMGQAR